MLYFYSVFLIFRDIHIDPNLVFGGVSRREMEDVIYSYINIKMWGQTSHFYSVAKVIKYLQIYLLTWQHLHIELAKKFVPILQKNLSELFGQPNTSPALASAVGSMGV